MNETLKNVENTEIKSLVEQIEELDLEFEKKSSKLSGKVADIEEGIEKLKSNNSLNEKYSSLILELEQMLEDLKEDSIYIEKVEIDKKPESEKKEKKLIDNPKKLEKRFRSIMAEHKFRCYPSARELGGELSENINSIKDFKKLINKIDSQFGEKQLYTDEEIKTKNEKGIYLSDQKWILRGIKEQINLEFIINSKDIISGLTELENGDFLDEKSKAEIYENLLSNNHDLPIEIFTEVLEKLDTRIYHIDLNSFSNKQIEKLKPTLNRLIDNGYIEDSGIYYPKKEEGLNNN